MASKKQKNQRRRGKRQSGADRHDKSREQHQRGGGEWDAVRIPEGLEVFKPEKGETYHIDIIPTIAGKYNRAAEPGYEWWELSYPVYNGLGIDEKKYIAIRELLGQPDPVAEHFAKLRQQDAEWDDMKLYKPKARQLMLVFVHEQAEKGLQFFEGAYGTFGEQLREEIDDAEDLDYVQNLDDPEGGATVEVRFKARNIGMANPWVLAGKVNFHERENGFDADGDRELAEAVLDKASEVCLDDCLKIPTYAQLEAALNGEPDPDEAPPADEAEEEDESEPAPAAKKATRRARKKAKPEPEVDEDEEDDIPMGDDDESEPEPEPEKAKAKKAKKADKPAPDPEPEGDDNGDDWDEDW